MTNTTERKTFVKAPACALCGEEKSYELKTMTYPNGTTGYAPRGGLTLGWDVNTVEGKIHNPYFCEDCVKEADNKAGRLQWQLQRKSADRMTKHLADAVEMAFTTNSTIDKIENGGHRITFSAHPDETPEQGKTPAQSSKGDKQ
jgi:ribosomal protein L37AE/L43A